MIITLLCFGLLLIGILFYILGKIGYKKKYLVSRNSIWFKFYTWFDGEVKTTACIILGTCFSIICLLIIVVNQFCINVDFETKLYEKKTIEYRIEHKDDNIVGNEMLYEDIVEFNNDIRQYKYFDNPWTNWFNNSKIAELSYIEYELAED